MSKKSADVHLFVSARGQAQPRWREAFGRSTRVARFVPEGLSKDVADPAVVWLRLEPGVGLAEQLARLPEALKSRPLVVMSDLPEDEEALAAFAGGARGYCNTHAAPPVLQQVAAVVLQGGLWIGEGLMRRLLVATSTVLAGPAAPAPPPVPAPVPNGRERSPGGAWADRLTEREREVALAISRGASNKEVGRLLGITERTVKAHLGAIFEKLGVRDRLQLALAVSDRPSPPPAA